MGAFLMALTTNNKRAIKTNIKLAFVPSKAVVNRSNNIFAMLNMEKYFVK